MKVTAVRTKLVEAFKTSLTDILSESLRSVPENSIIAITSKVVSLCEGSVLPLAEYSKDELIESEADAFVPKSHSSYGVYLTQKNGMLAPSAGIDESNTNGYFVMWPKDPQKTANQCWEFIKERFKVKNIGIIITDSTTAPLRWGVTGRCIAHCGFVSLNSRVGETDLFGKTLRQTRINVVDALAASAVFCMGESVEQTPVAIVEDIPFVEFQQHVPTQEELEALKIDIKDDLYAPFLTSVQWISGKKPLQKKHGQ